MRISKFIIIFCLTLITISATNCYMLFAEEMKGSGSMAGKAHSNTVAEAVQTVFEAKVICLGCSLKKEEGAVAQCSVYGHENALRMQNGSTWTILENDASTELVNNHDYAGKNVEITGRQFKKSKIIQVDSFEVIE